MSQKTALFFERLKKAPRSLAVAGIALMASQGWWYPLLEAASNGMFGDDVQKWAVLSLGILAVLGWATPQRSIPSASTFGDGLDKTDRNN